MRRALLYILLLGILTGLVLGIAVFGLPLPADESAQAPGLLCELVLSLGFGLADAAVAGGALAILLLLLVAIADLRRHARNRRL